MSNLDDITKRIGNTVNKVKAASELSNEPKNNYQWLYDTADYATLPGQTLNKSGANLWESLAGNQYGNEAAGTLASLAPFLLFKKYPLGLIGGYVAPNVFNSTLNEPSIKGMAEGKDIPNSSIAFTLGNAAADLHPAMFVPKMAASVLARPVATISPKAGLALANMERFNIFNPFNIAAKYGENEKITKYVNDKWDDYKHNLKYAWDNDKQSLPFVASAGLFDYAIRSLFSDRLQDF